MKISIPKLISIVIFFWSASGFSQVTTASLRGHVTDNKNEDVIGAVVKALHTESGTLYGAQTDALGNFRIQGLRIGGPYLISVTYIGYQKEEKNNIFLSLGETQIVDFTLNEENAVLKEVVIKSTPSDPLKQQKTGSSQQISSVQLQKLPTLSRSLGDFTRLVPQGAGGVNLGSNNSPIPSFGGADVRFSNISIDGSVFNNSFGLSPTPGGQTGANFISLDAIEQIQVNISPYDVKQGGFTGAGVNMVTKSGTNHFKGTAFYNFRNNNLAGNKINEESISLNEFAVHQFGLSIGGPIIKDKLFFFVNAEIEQRNDPGTTFKARKDTLENDAEITRVFESDLIQLQSFLKEKYNYNTGAYQNYQLNTFSNKGVLKLDYNLSHKHKVVFRTNYLFSSRDIPIVNSGAVSARRDNLFSMSYENSNFRQFNNLLSFITEINSMISVNLSNSLKVGYTINRDYRDNSNVFPLVDIMKDGRNYISFGTDPFTSNNEVKTGTFQITDNLTLFKGNHTYTIGASLEHYSFKNIFTPYFQSQYIYKSLDDFYASAAGDTNVTLQRFRMGYSTGNAGSVPEAVTKSTFASLYIQDEYNYGKWMLNYGIRADLNAFAQTAIENPVVTNMVFRGANGAQEKYNTSQLPSPAILISPRIGVSYRYSESIRLRGGTGIFTGRPAFVFIGNQVSNNGMLQGSIFQNNTNAYPFNPSINHYKPSNPSLPSSYSLSLVNPNYQYPQIWRSSFAIDKKLNWKELLIGAELVFSKQLNNFYYENVNQTGLNDTMKFKGADQRNRYWASYGLGSANNINSSVTDAIVLKNSNKGYAYTLTIKGEFKPTKNEFVYVAYNYGVARDIGSAGSVAFNSWAGYYSTQGNNFLGTSISDYEQRHRFIATFSKGIQWNKTQKTNVSIFGELRNGARFTYAYLGDMNGDGLFGNDLLYVPLNNNEIKFSDYTSAGVTYTAQAQADAFNQFIEQDEYLKTRRGNYVERNGAVMPWITRIDLSVAHDLGLKNDNHLGGFQFRLDLFNALNLLNSKWGRTQIATNTNPLTLRSINAEGEPVYNMTTVNGNLNYTSFTNRKTINDVWQLQLGVRYSF